MNHGDCTVDAVVDWDRAILGGEVMMTPVFGTDPNARLDVVFRTWDRSLQPSRNWFSTTGCRQREFRLGYLLSARYLSDPRRIPFHRWDRSIVYWGRGATP